MAVLSASCARPRPRAFILLKPDGVPREKEILRFLEPHFTVLARRRFASAPMHRISALYAEHEGKPFHPWLMDALRGKPVVAFVLEGRRRMSGAALHRLLAGVVGDTDPRKAAPGTIRALSDDDMTVSMRQRRSVRNLVHRSRTPAETEAEGALFFFDQPLPGSAPVVPGPATLALASPLGGARPCKGLFLQERLQAALAGLGLLPKGAILAGWRESSAGRIRTAEVHFCGGGRARCLRLVIDRSPRRG